MRIPESIFRYCIWTDSTNRLILFHCVYLLCAIQLLYPPQASAVEYLDLIEVGSYTVIGPNSTFLLSCRVGPGLGAEVKQTLEVGTLVKAEKVEYSKENKPWFYTDYGCYVRANSKYLKLAQDGETQGDSSAIIGGLVLVLVVLFLLSKLTGTETHNIPEIITPEKSRERLSEFYNSNQDGHFLPQVVFDDIHPIGTASRIAVRDVAINWKNNRPSSREEDISSLSYVLDLYWSSPITPDGHTRNLCHI